jgi:hypothetical protein
VSVGLAGRLLKAPGDLLGGGRFGGDLVEVPLCAVRLLDDAGDDQDDDDGDETDDEQDRWVVEDGLQWIAPPLDPVAAIGIGPSIEKPAARIAVGNAVDPVAACGGRGLRDCNERQQDVHG